MSKLSCLIAIPAALVLAAPSAWAADDERVITAIASRNQPAWLSMYGPDADGAYSARISISDLDLTSASDRDALFGRVKGGVRKLCVRATYEPSGNMAYFRPAVAEGRCRSTTLASAQPQIDSAISAAGRGEHVAYLGMAIASRAR